ncbi:MAG: PilN domain-containing protein [Rudaea sp.]
MAVIADPTLFKNTGYRRDLARRLGLTGFLSWWRAELSAAMPASLRGALERRHARPVLAFSGSRATLWQLTRTNGRAKFAEAADIPLFADAETVVAAGRAALAPLVRAGNGKTPEVVVALSPRAALRKTVTLPAAIEDHLRQSLAYDIDRHTPFKSEDVYFDAIVADRDPARNTLQVDLAAARRSVVDAIVRQVESFGARVVAVIVDPPAEAAAACLNLLPEDRRPEASGMGRWQVVLPALLLALGVLTSLYLPIWQKREQVIALNRVAGEAQQRAAASDALRTELEQRVGDYNFALERKYAFPGAVQVLEDVTRILPDDTWLTQFELHSGRGKDAPREITLRGESANAGRLVSLLEESKVFTQAAPRSPTTKIQPGPGEIFDVSAHLNPVPPPPRLPLDMTPVPTPAPAAPKPAAAPAAAVRPATGAAGTAASSSAHTSPTAGRASNAQKARPGTAAESPPAPVAPAAEAVPTAPGTIPAGAEGAQEGLAHGVSPPEAPADANDGFGPRPEGFAPKSEEGE